MRNYTIDGRLRLSSTRKKSTGSRSGNCPNPFASAFTLYRSRTRDYNIVDLGSSSLCFLAKWPAFACSPFVRSRTFGALYPVFPTTASAASRVSEIVEVSRRCGTAAAGRPFSNQGRWMDTLQAYCSFVFESSVFDDLQIRSASVAAATRPFSSSSSFSSQYRAWLVMYRASASLAGLNGGSGNSVHHGNLTIEADLHLLGFLCDRVVGPVEWDRVLDSKLEKCREKRLSQIQTKNRGGES